jgi:hypothetical protein
MMAFGDNPVVGLDLENDVLTDLLTLTARSLLLMLLLVVVYGDGLDRSCSDSWCSFLLFRASNVEIYTIRTRRFHLTNENLGNRNTSSSQLDQSRELRSHMDLEESAVASLLFPSNVQMAPQRLSRHSMAFSLMDDQ